MDEPIVLNYANICDGAMIEALQMKLNQVMANICDVSTPATVTRSVTLKLKFKPKEDRCQVAVEFSCDATLASIEPHSSRMFIAKGDDEQFYALDRDPRQMNIFTPAAPKAVAPPIQFAAKS